MFHVICITVQLFLLFIALPSNAQDFPFRDKYPEVRIIELAELKSGYDRGDFLIVDVRAKSEFETIHIRDAVHLSYAEARFIERLRKLSLQHPGKKIVVYDNGIDCIKSYKAAEDALYEMIPNVYAFDHGIEAWARNFPGATILLGDVLLNPDQQLLSRKQFAAHTLDFESFKEGAHGENSVVIDARDPIQRKHDLPGIQDKLNIPVDKLVANIITPGRLKDKQLYIYDQVGRQVKWLMYHLVEKGYTDFHFLAGGATAVLHEQEYRVAVH